jgi:hypothetical protein
MEQKNNILKLKSFDQFTNLNLLKMKSTFFIGENNLNEINNNYKSLNERKNTNIEDYEMKINRRILIVDDEPYNILGLTIIL